MRTWPPLAALLALAACASPADRISTALVRYGLDQPRADCVGAELEERLTIGQLQQLSAAARAYRSDDADPARLTPGDLVRVAGELRDPAVPTAVARAGLGCGVVPGF